jgi:rhamnopyranosyl-N-acetylglucosaminyl-diphospho-decaprenol beta-1,3/1,4-galactofuranosyltransferase
VRYLLLADRLYVYTSLQALRLAAPLVTSFEAAHKFLTISHGKFINRSRSINRWVLKIRVRVCAVTVAYNNPEELTCLLSSLNSQNNALCGLIVIDNSDERYSEENKKAFSINASQYTFSRYNKTKSNIGSAGGFRSGMEIAHENGFHWVWLLDQDGIVSSGCLTELLRHAEGGAILCPNIVDIERPRLSMPKAYTMNFLGGLYPATWCLKRCQIHAFGTHGALISKKSLDIIGYYDDTLFFVGAEDFDYGFRATEAGLVIALVLGAEAKHRVGLKLTKLSRLLPQHLIGVKNVHESMPCMKTRSAGAFSHAYLLSKRLKSWQFAIALVYALCRVLYKKITAESGISLKKTLRLWLRCLAYSLKKEWPYNSIGELCRSILL